MATMYDTTEIKLRGMTMYKSVTLGPFRYTYDRSAGKRSLEVTW